MATFEQTLKKILDFHQKAVNAETERVDTLKSPEYTADQKDTLDRQYQEQIATLNKYKISALDELLRYPPHHLGILNKLDEFHKRGAYEKSVFIMTKFPGGNKKTDKGLEKVIQLVQKGVTDAGFVPRIASEKDYHQLLWNNVALYLLGCSKGIAIVESKSKAELNPNVAMEWGWMRAMDKPVLFLAEKGFDLHRADWKGLIEHEFMWDKPGSGINAAVKKFLS